MAGTKLSGNPVRFSATATSKSIDVLSVLLLNGALIEARDNDGQAPLSWARATG